MHSFPFHRYPFIIFPSSDAVKKEVFSIYQAGSPFFREIIFSPTFSLCPSIISLMFASSLKNYPDNKLHVINKMPSFADTI